MMRLARVWSFFRLCQRAAEPRFGGISKGTNAGLMAVAKGVWAYDVASAAKVAARMIRLAIRLGKRMDWLDIFRSRSLALVGQLNQLIWIV